MCNRHQFYMWVSNVINIKDCTETVTLAISAALREVLRVRQIKKYPSERLHLSAVSCRLRDVWKQMTAVNNITHVHCDRTQNTLKTDRKRERERVIRHNGSLSERDNGHECWRPNNNRKLQMEQKYIKSVLYSCSAKWQCLSCAVYKFVYLLTYL